MLSCVVDCCATDSISPEHSPIGVFLLRSYHILGRTREVLDQVYQTVTRKYRPAS